MPVKNGFRATTVTKAINDYRLSLVDGSGYWYFVFDDIERSVFETHSVMVQRLSDLSLEQWIEQGNDFVAKMKKQIEDRRMAKLAKGRR